MRHIVQSDTPRAGFYWAVPFYDALDTDSNGQSIAFFLLPPSFAVTPYSATQLLDPVDANWQQINMETNAVLIMAGKSDNGTTTTIISQRSAVSPVSPSLIVVPSGWSMAAIETNGVVSGTLHHLTMRIGYLELANGEQIPNL